MPAAEPSFTVGIEEEYLLVDRISRDVAIDPPHEILEQCQAVAGAGLVEAELLRSQVEVDTRVCATVAEARQDLARLRRTISEVAGSYGLAPLAATDPQGALRPAVPRHAVAGPALADLWHARTHRY